MPGFRLLKEKMYSIFYFGKKSVFETVPLVLLSVQGLYIVII